MQPICQLGGERAGAGLQVCRQGAQAGTLARPCTHAGTSAHSSHAEDINSNLFQCMGFMVCAYLLFPATEREPDSLHKSPGGCTLWVGVSQQYHLWQSMQLI